MDAYYVELARGVLSDAAKRLRDAQQYMAQAGDLQYEMDQISRTISSVDNRNRDLGQYIMSGQAKHR